MKRTIHTLYAVNLDMYANKIKTFDPSEAVKTFNVG